MIDGPLKFFPTPGDFRKWLEKNYKREQVLWVGFYKTATKIPSITWPESVDQALCFGWIDGLRKSIDDKSYKIRFTPRKPGSHWSQVNLAKMKELKKKGIVTKDGLDAFNKRRADKTARASYEQKNVELSPDFEKRFRSNKSAWRFFQKLPPSTQTPCMWWVMSAKREETKVRRLQVLIDSSAESKILPQLRWSKKNK